jgi:hypothetical protein
MVTQTWRNPINGSPAKYKITPVLDSLLSFNILLFAQLYQVLKLNMLHYVLQLNVRLTTETKGFPPLMSLVFGYLHCSTPGGCNTPPQ